MSLISCKPIHTRISPVAHALSMVYRTIMSSYINSLTLQGILSFAPDSPPIALNRLNVIIGPNGSGKSNFVDILRFITTIPNDIEQGFRSLGGQSDFFWRGDWQDKNILSKINVSMAKFGLSLGEINELNYGIVIAPIENEFIIEDEELNAKGKSIPFLFSPVYNKKEIQYNSSNIALKALEIAISKGELDKLLSELIEKNSSDSNYSKDSMLKRDFRSYAVNAKNETDSEKFSFYNRIIRHFHNFLSDNLILQTWEMGRRAEIRRPQPTDYPVSRLMSNYRNLGLILNEIKNRDPELIYAPMRRIIPDFDRLNIDILGGNIAINISERGLKGPTSAFRMSDGTLRFLAILAAIHCKDPPSILVIEEPEIALHPDALICLAEILIEASKEMQIFITTHSEVLLSAFRNQLDSVLVCENIGGRGTTLTHLDPDNLKIWLDKFSLGDIWRAGQIGGNP